LLQRCSHALCGTLIVFPVAATCSRGWIFSGSLAHDSKQRLTIALQSGLFARCGAHEAHTSAAESQGVLR
jgi:hypothetical protein